MHGSSIVGSELGLSYDVNLIYMLGSILGTIEGYSVVLLDFVSVDIIEIV